MGRNELYNDLVDAEGRLFARQEAADELADAAHTASIGLTEAASSLQRRGAERDSEAAFWRRDLLDAAIAKYRKEAK